MPPKRKTTANTATAGPKPKRNKPVFQSIKPASTTSLNTTRVSTLQTNAAGRRGYYSQEQSATSSRSKLESSSTSNPTSEIGSSSIANVLACNLVALEPDDYLSPNQIPKLKSKNTTAVSNSFLFYICFTYTFIVKAYRMACLSPNMLRRTTLT